MPRNTKIKYDPSLSVAENAKKCGVTEDAIRYYIRTRGIDRRYEGKMKVLEGMKAYIAEHPNATRAELQRATGHGINTVRRYWDVLHGNTTTEQFKSCKVKSITRTDLDKRLENPDKIANGHRLASEMLKEAADILRFAEQADITKFREWLLSDATRPLICIGNGGKHTTYPALLYQMMASIGKAATPLEFATMSPEAIKNSKVLLLSNAGRNLDIKYATKRAVKYNKDYTACFTFTDSEENAMVKALGMDKSFVVKNNYKDDFISIRSKILTYGLLYKAFSGDSSFAHRIRTEGRYNVTINKSGKLPRWENISHFNLLYGSYGEPVAHDIESTMVEGGIASVQLCDYRNFCHGRFIFGSNHCANKRVAKTDVCTILLITPREEKLAQDIRNKTMANNMPIVEIRTEEDSPLATIQLLIDALTFVFNLAEKCHGINPNSPKNYSKIDKRVPINGIPFAQELSRFGELHYTTRPQEIALQVESITVRNNEATQAEVSTPSIVKIPTEIKSICGGVLGDISGCTREKSSKSVYTTDFDLFPPKSHPTDDSVLTVAIADWLLHKDTISLSETLRRWGKKYPRAGYGGGFKAYIKSGKDYCSDRNGAAMRVSPVAVVASSLDEALSLAKESALPTHNSVEGIKGAQSIAAAIYLVREGVAAGKPASAIKSEIKTYIEDTFGYDLNQSIESIRERSKRYAEMKIIERATGYKDPEFRFMSEAAVSVPMAFVAFLSGNSYEEVLRIAISLGGDADTIGCMASSISVHLYGIPQAIYDEGCQFIPSDMMAILEEFDAKYLAK